MNQLHIGNSQLIGVRIKGLNTTNREIKYGLAADVQTSYLRKRD